MAARSAGIPLRRFSPHFFLLGIAFLLLETRSLVTFSLLFGTTWLVNSLVFFAVLVSVLLSILINGRVRFQNPIPLYAALLASLVVAFLLPADRLLIEPIWLRYLAASVVAFAPIFFANLVFSHSFRDTWTADMAFAVNLLGAMAGGALEYLALITGYQALLIVIGGCTHSRGSARPGCGCLPTPTSSACRRYDNGRRSGSGVVAASDTARLALSAA